ncbi:hypothetical protein IMSAGC011_00214 [Lachnospiraceae bacterium]|nr:hypothetical protein IMSAGC011_00214 [Lachnospiraceae bacterium]
MAIQLKPYTPVDLINKIRDNDFSYTSSYVKKITETDTDIQKLQDSEDSFRKKLKMLKSYSPGGTSKDMVEKRLEDFIKSYNDLEKDSASITDPNVKKQVSKLKKLFSEHEKDLRKVGITKEKGKYSLNYKIFKNAKDKSIDQLLVGHDSFIGKADKIMRKLEETTDNAEYSIVEHKITQTTEYKENDVLLATKVTLAGSILSALQKNNSLVQSSVISNPTFQEDIKKSLTSFADFIYNTNNTDHVETIGKLNQLCLDHKEELSKIGLTFDSENKKMRFDDTIDLTTNDFTSNFNTLFGENAVFGTTAAQDCKKIIHDLLQPEKIGVSIIDQQI